MALIKCSECGKEISDKATACPSCGFPIPQINNQSTSHPPSSSQTNQANNGGTNGIIWVAGIMIVIVGGVFLLGENEANFNKKKNECRQDSTFDFIYSSKYGRISWEYQKLLEACARKGRYGFSEKKVLGDLYKP